jgi:hypothetical protein
MLRNVDANQDRKKIRGLRKREYSFFVHENIRVQTRQGFGIVGWGMASRWYCTIAVVDGGLQRSKMSHVELGEKSVKSENNHLES